MSDSLPDAQQEYKNKREREMEKLGQARQRDIQKRMAGLPRALAHNLNDVMVQCWNDGYEHGKTHPEGP